MFDKIVRIYRMRSMNTDTFNLLGRKASSEGGRFVNDVETKISVIEEVLRIFVKPDRIPCCLQGLGKK